MPSPSSLSSPSPTTSAAGDAPFLFWSEISTEKLKFCGHGTHRQINLEWHNFRDLILHLDASLSERLKEDFAIGCGVLHKKDLARVDWAKMVDGAAFVLPFVNCGKRRYCSDEPKVKDQLRIVVFPLSIIMIVGQTQLDHHNDFRTGYVWDTNREKIPEAACKHGESFYGGFRCRADKPEIRQLHLVFNGAELDPIKTCRSCPKSLENSLDRCELGAFNCELGTRYKPEMLVAPPPRLTDFFGESRRHEYRDVFYREPFVSYSLARLNVAAAVGARKRFSESAVEAGVTRRLVKHQCGACVFKNPPLCGKKPVNCGGPFLQADVEDAQRDIPAWICHALQLSASKTVVSITDVRKVIDLGRRKADFRVLGPLPLSVLGKYEHLNYAVSPAAKASSRKVLLLPVKNREQWHGCCLVDYQELCGWLGRTAVNSREIADHLTSEVNIALGRWLLDGVDFNIGQYDNLSFSSENLSYYCGGRGCGNGGLSKNLSHACELVFALRDCLSSKRKSENVMLNHVLLKTPAKKLTMPVPDILTNIRSLGAEATVQLLSKKRPIKSLPVIQ